MANARKCDRCGEYYKEYGVTCSKRNCNGIAFLNLDSQGRYLSHDPRDLCKDCMTELKQFLEMKKPAEAEDTSCKSAHQCSDTIFIDGKY